MIKNAPTATCQSDCAAAGLRWPGRKFEVVGWQLVASLSCDELGEPLLGIDFCLPIVGLLGK
jgi:hypothetical protein